MNPLVNRMRFQRGREVFHSNTGLQSVQWKRSSFIPTAGTNKHSAETERVLVVSLPRVRILESN